MKVEKKIIIIIFLIFQSIFVSSLQIKTTITNFSTDDSLSVIFGSDSLFKSYTLSAGNLSKTILQFSPQIKNSSGNPLDSFEVTAIGFVGKHIYTDKISFVIDTDT
ncbi:TPA: hypothetical protein DCW38_00575, partial [candidate division WOR-3 bacterium]|nr:hypothetical protein [candidate division WOR-3 bacterium]